MSQLVNDLLLLSRLDSGKLVLSLSAVTVADFLQETGRQFSPIAADKGVTLSVHAQGGQARADLTRLRQVVLILLDNAIRHTPSGGPIRLESAASATHLTVSVIDTGEGITAKHLPHGFERFYRVDTARDREAGGSGLGLAIAQTLIRAQHGQITIKSAPGQGTRVGPCTSLEGERGETLA